MLSRVASPPLLLCVVAGLAYAVVEHRRRVPRPRRAWPVPVQTRRSVSFYAGLAVIVIALDSPVEDMAGRLFFVHMTQHLLLTFVAAPLVVYGAPWLAPLRLLPARVHRPLSATVVGWRDAAWWRRARPLVGPALAWLLFNVDLWAWHLPALYDATLRHQAIHDVEHLTLLVLGVLFWVPLVDSPPLRSALAPMERCGYIVAAMASSWALALALAIAPHTLYTPYAHQASRPWGISAMGDQQLAAGVMWGPGSVPLTIALFVAIYGWVGAADPRRRRPGRRQRGDGPRPTWPLTSGRTT